MKRKYVCSQGLDEEKKERADKELSLGFLNLSDGFFEQARMNFELALQFDEHAPDAFWGLMLCNLQVRDEDELSEFPMKHKDALKMKECILAQDYATNELKAIYKTLLENIAKVSEGENY